MTTAVSQPQASEAPAHPKKEAASFKKASNAPKSPQQIEYERRMTELDGRINYLRARMDELKGLHHGSGAEGGARGKLLDELKALREESRPMQEQRRAWIREAGECREILKKRSDELKAAKDKMPFKTVPEIEAKIAAYEHQLETSNFKLSEEKSIVAEISKLNKARRALSDLSGNNNDILAIQGRLDAVQEKIKGTDAAHNEAKAKIDALSAKLDALNGARKEQQQSREEKQQQFEKLRKELDEAFEAKRKAFEENKAYRAAAYEAKLKRDARWKEEKRRQEIEERIEDLEERLQAYNPESVLDKKFAECQNMISFFSGLTSSGPAAKAEAPASLLAAPVGRQVVLSEELANAVPIKKDEDEVYFASGSGGKHKKGGAKKASASSSDSALPKLPLHVLTGLGDLNLAIPATNGQVPVLLEALAKIKAALEAKKAESEASGQDEVDPKQKALIDQIAALKLELDKPAEEAAAASE